MPESAPFGAELERVIRLTTVRVAAERYAYLRTDTLPERGNHLMVFSCGDDNTVVTQESQVHDIDYTAMEEWFRLFEFHIPIPFQAPGFLASIASAVADERINILMISTFPRDYALVKESEVERAIRALRRRGFPISNPD